MRNGWLLGLGVALALAAPASAQRAVTWGNPVTTIQNRVVNTKKAFLLPTNSNIPIAQPYVLAPQHTSLSLSSFLPTQAGKFSAKPTHGSTAYPTAGQMPNLGTLSAFGLRTTPW